MLDQGCNLKDDDCVNKAKVLVANHIVYLKKAAIDHSGSEISWDGIVIATRESTFFQHCSGLLLEVNPDLVRFSVAFMKSMILMVSIRNTNQAVKPQHYTTSPILTTIWRKTLRRSLFESCTRLAFVLTTTILLPRDLLL
jgi:hypothetical protein